MIEHMKVIERAEAAIRRLMSAQMNPRQREREALGLLADLGSESLRRKLEIERRNYEFLGTRALAIRVMSDEFKAEKRGGHLRLPRETWEKCVRLMGSEDPVTRRLRYKASSEEGKNAPDA